MRPFLIVLTILVFAADAVLFFQFHKWLDRLEHHLNEPLSGKEEHHVLGLLKRIGILSSAAALLVLILIFL